jgi:nucleotide-binding universal stress UspA family protein
MTDAHRGPGEPEGHDRPVAPVVQDGGDAGADAPRPRVEPMRLSPLLPRRQHPWLVVDVDGSPSSYGALLWALREAARREAVVVAVCVLDDVDDDPLGGLGRPTRQDAAAALRRLDAQVLRAIGETGVSGRSRTTVLERPVFEALTGAARGADLVLVSSSGKALLRHAVPRPPVRRLARGA